MSIKKNIVTKELFKLFKEECFKYINAFGLADWNIRVTCEGDADECGALASVYFSNDGLNAHIRISKNWGEQEISKIQVLRCAVHEVCHLLTARMENLALDRFATEKEIIEESERIARRVEHSVWQWRK